MADSVTTSATSSYVQVALAGAWTSFQITGTGVAEVYFGDTAGTKQGFMFTALDGANVATFGDAKISVRIFNGQPKITVFN